jgi:hypothetical protein
MLNRTGGLKSALKRPREEPSTTTRKVGFKKRDIKKINADGELGSSIEETIMTQVSEDEMEAGYVSDASDSSASTVVAEDEDVEATQPLPQEFKEEEIEVESKEYDLSDSEFSTSSQMSLELDLELDLNQQDEIENSKEEKPAEVDILYPITRQNAAQASLLFNNNPTMNNVVKTYEQAIKDLLSSAKAYFASARTANPAFFAAGPHTAQTFVANFIKLVCRIYKQPDFMKVLEEGDNYNLAQDKLVLESLAKLEDKIKINVTDPYRTLRKFLKADTKAVIRTKISHTHSSKVLGLILYKMGRLFIEKDDKLLPYRKPGANKLGKELGIIFMNHAKSLGLKKVDEKLKIYENLAARSEQRATSLRYRR